MRYEEIELTHTIAAGLLERNGSNRPVKRDVVRRYADDLTAGRWALTGEAIKVDLHDNLVDGQHRCLAVLLANEERGEEAPPIVMRTLLIVGVEPAAQDVMDSGKTRSVADQLARKNIAYATRLAAASRLVIAFERGIIRTNMVTNGEALAWFDVNRKKLEDINITLSDHHNTSGINMSVLIAARYIIEDTTTDETAVEGFFHAAATGVDLAAEHPAMGLRNRMLQAKLGREVLPNILATHMVLRAWNAHRRGTPLGKMAIRVKGQGIYIKEVQP